jgi:hypothetical protein
MSEIIMAKIKMFKIIMTKPTMVKLTIILNQLSKNSFGSHQPNKYVICKDISRGCHGKMF